MNNRNNRLAIIHIAKDELIKKNIINEEAYLGILSGAEVSSAADIKTDEQFNTVMNSFVKLGFRYQKRSDGVKYKKTVPGRNPNFISDRQEYYIRGLWDLASRAKDEQSLLKLIKRIAKVDDIRFIPKKYSSAVILALRDICWKAGFNPDKKPE